MATTSPHPQLNSYLYGPGVYDVTTESAATVQVSPQHTDNGRFPVRQHGPRRLWDEVETAHAWWIEHGCPGRACYGLTITPDTQTVWLDQPNNTVAALRECLLPARV
jgi:hypothetical protein